MSPEVREAELSLVFAGVSRRSVRAFSPSGSTRVVAICVRHGVALHAEGADLIEAMTRLARAAGLVAYLERAEQRLCEAAS